MKVRAARLVAHNQPLILEEVELGEPRPGEVLVRMAFAGVNPVDRYQAEGRVAPDAPIPRTLGGEGAGWIEAPHERAGEAVLLFGHGLGGSRDGVWAEAAIVPEEAAIPVPGGVTLEQAAAMGIAGVTAWRCAFEKAELTGADRVLVLGASGGVGSMLVSIARSLGAEVWGQTGAEPKVPWIESTGATKVIVGDAGDLTEQCGGWRPTVVFDALGAGYFGAAVTVMQEKGRLVSFGTSAGPHGDVPLQLLYRKGLTVYGYGGLIETDAARAKWIREALEGLRIGRMDVLVGEVVSLDDVNRAFRQLTERAVKGKIVIAL